MKTTKDYTFKYQGTNPMLKLRDGEPYFFLRAQDKLSPEAVQAYADLLHREANRAFNEGKEELSNTLRKQALGVLNVAHVFLDWQADNLQFVKIPD